MTKISEKRLKRLWNVIMIGMIATLPACTKLISGDFCAIADPIEYSALFDTQETIQQIREHNAVYDELCN